MENNQPRFNSGTERMEHFIRMCKRFGIQVDIKRLSVGSTMNSRFYLDTAKSL